MAGSTSQRTMISEELQDFVRLRSLNRYKDAEQLFDTHLRHHLDEFPICLEYAELLLQTGQLQDVIALCQQDIDATAKPMEPMGRESGMLRRHPEEILTLRLMRAVAETSLQGSLSPSAIEACDEAWMDFKGSNAHCKEYALVLLARLSAYLSKSELKVDYHYFLFDVFDTPSLNAPECAFAQNAFLAQVIDGEFQAAALIYGSTAKMWREYKRRELLSKVLIVAVESLPLKELDHIAVMAILQTYLHTLSETPMQGERINVDLHPAWQWNDNIEPLDALAGLTRAFKLYLPYLMTMLGDIARGDGPASFLPYISFPKALASLLSEDGHGLDFFWPRAMSGVTRRAFFVAVEEKTAWTTIKDFDIISTALRGGIEPEEIIDHLMNQENQRDARLYSAELKQRVFGYVTDIRQFVGREETLPTRAMMDAALQSPIPETPRSADGGEQRVSSQAENDRQSILNTLLRMASFSGKTYEMELLIRVGADIEGQDALMRRPLHYAYMNEAASAIDLLMESGANNNAIDWYGRSGLNFGSTWAKRYRSQQATTQPVEQSYRRGTYPYLGIVQLT